MIEIALLGRVSVSVAGRPVSGEAAQRRRLALLALLCGEGLRPVSRDRLMAFLWPDSDSDSARHLLSAALHVLRKALGADAIVTTGDAVGLDPARVTVDAVDFQTAVRGGELERAVALYGGAFAEGLTIPGSVDFDHWLDARREEYVRLYAAALEGAAQARTQRGELDGAVDAWRRLAALDPYSARTTLGLMHALVAAGQRAGALQAARVHARLLEAEFDAAPDAEVIRLADELRQESDGATSPRAAAAAAAGDAGAADAAPPAHSAVGDTGVPDVVGHARPDAPMPSAGVAAPAPPPRHGWRLAVAALALALLASAAFAVYRLLNDDAVMRVIAVVPLRGADTEHRDDHIAAGIAEGIHHRLSSSPQLHVVNSATSFLFRDSTADAREIGARLGADAIVFVRLRGSDDELRVRVELARARDRVVLWDTLHTTSRGSIFALEDELARPIGAALRVRLGGAPATAQGRGAGDEVAQELYWRAREEWRRRTPDALLRALPLFERAIQRDPTHALAHVGLADTYNLLGTFEYGVLPPDSAFPLSLAAAEKALSVVPDFAPALAARANVRMNYQWDWDGAERDFRRALENDPAYTEAREWLAWLLIARDRRAEAVEMLEAARAHGASPLLFVNLAQYHYFRSDYDAALDNIRQALALDPAFSRAHALFALVLCQHGRAAEGVALLERLTAFAEGDPLLIALLGYAYARAGREPDAAAQADRLRALASQRYVPAEHLAIVHIGLAEYDRALDHLETAFARRSTGMLYLRQEPLLRPLHDQPRLQALLSRVHGG